MIDQLRIGWYGMLAIESMALAKPVVVHLDEEAAAETEEAFGLELPLVRASETDLEDVLAGLIERRETLPEHGRRSRAYVERVHAHTEVARQVLEIYERVMPDQLVEADRRPREPAYARPQLDVLRRLRAAGSPAPVLELLHEDPPSTCQRAWSSSVRTARRMSASYVRSHQCATLNALAAGKEVEDVVGVEDLGAPAEQHHSIPAARAGRQGARAPRVSDARHGEVRRPSRGLLKPDASLAAVGSASCMRA